ncbi:MAG: flavodoxin [Clostridiales Family XIII bacterium]|nr:flavodoxin [Clostridiales Family XIII bacterium]
MSKTAIVYWSQTENTKKMAELIADGAKSAGAEVDLFEVGSTTPDNVSEYDLIALGCPSMGAEVLEEGEFQPFYDKLREKLTGKKVALFGSYGWGDGQWMRDWQSDVVAAGANLYNGEGFIVNYDPTDGETENCKNFGSGFASF